MVRLKAGSIRAGRYTAQFQFPNGSIKRQEETCSGCIGTWFQFPNGSIKRGERSRARGSDDEFQFPNGSIKRRFWSSFFTLSSGFNSLMVRLKVLKLLGASKEFTSFNSLMVRLKGIGLIE